MSTEPSPETVVPADAPVAEQVASLQWYHSFDLPGGVSTPGYYDHRSIVGSVPIPSDLSGKRCLDAASADGFWALEMARRGAAEVVSLDLDDATRQDWQGLARGVDRNAGTGRAHRAFDIANRALDARVERRDLSIYDVSAEELGTFDFVFVGNILIHLQDPQRALVALRRVCRGELLSFEVISVLLTVMRPFTACGQLWHEDEPRWWTPNARAHRRLVEAAGFEVLDSHWPVRQPFGKLVPRFPRPLPRLPREWAWWAFVRPFGISSQWVRAHPITG